MTTFWAAFCLTIIVVGLAAEGYALYTGKQTFSRFVWNASKAWPPLPLVVGLVIGFLCAHFWWGGSLICY